MAFNMAWLEDAVQDGRIRNGRAGRSRAPRRAVPVLCRLGQRERGALLAAAVPLLDHDRAGGAERHVHGPAGPATTRATPKAPARPRPARACPACSQPPRAHRPRARPHCSRARSITPLVVLSLHDRPRPGGRGVLPQLRRGPDDRPARAPRRGPKDLGHRAPAARLGLESRRARRRALDAGHAPPPTRPCSASAPSSPPTPSTPPADRGTPPLRSAQKIHPERLGLIAHLSR